MLSRRLAVSEEEAARPVRHPGDLIRVTAGALILAASAAVAGRSTAARSEVDLFRLINDLPSVLTEYEALLSLLAARAWVRTPELVAISALPDGSGVLVTRLIHGESLGQSGQALGDDQLKDTWEQVARLHAARIAHRDLRRANIVIDDDGRPWIVDFGFAEAAASDRLLAQDTAELLVSLALVVGVERAVASACGVLAAETLRAALPLMQPLALSAATRRDLRARPELLPDLRRRVTAVLGLDEEPPPEPLLRVRPRHLLVLAVAVLAVHVIIPQVTELHAIVGALGRTRWDWLAAALVSMLIRFNVPSGPAIAGVLAFRLVTYWLPLFPAAAAFRALHRSGAL